MSSPTPTPPLSTAASLNRQSRLSPEATYSDEAVQAILRRALELRGNGRFSAQQLQEMANELDISPEMLSAAVAEWDSQSLADIPPAAHRPALTARQQQWRQYAIASVLMVGIDIATAGALTWSIFPVLGWGCGLAFGKQCDRP